MKKEAANMNNSEMESLVPAQQPDLRFEAEGHIYSVGGITYPSVTQILSGCKIVDYSFLGEPSADAFTVDSRTACLERGRRVHLATELYDLDELDVTTVDAADMGYLQAWECFRRDWKFTPFSGGVEVRRYHPTLGYAGTIDRLGRMARPRTMNPLNVVLDIKTGVSLPWWIDLQLTGYAGMLDEPRRWERIAVLLRKDGTYLVARQTTPYDDQMRVFMYALAIERLKRDKGGKQ